MKQNWWKVLVVVVLVAAVGIVVAGKRKVTNDRSGVARESTATSSFAAQERTEDPANDQLATSTSESGNDTSAGCSGAQQPAGQVKSGDVCPTPPPKKTQAASPPKSVVPAKTEAPEAKPETVRAKVLPRLVDLGAKTCIPCKMMAPILEELTEEYKGKLVVKFIDVWKNRGAAEQYGIRTIPTQIFYDRNGKEFFRHVGFFSKEEIIAAFKKQGINLEKE